MTTKKTAKKTVKKTAKVTAPTVVPIMDPSPPVKASAFDKGILFKFTMGMPSFRAKVDKSKIDAGDADKSMISVGMKLIECDEYDAIRTMYGDIKKYLELRGILTELRNALYLIPIDIANEVMERMETYKTELAVKTEAFLKVYKPAKESAKKKLGKLFNDDVYPNESTLAARFYLEFEPEPEPMVMPEKKLQSLNPKLFQVYKLELQKKVESAAEGMRVMMRQQLLEMAQHFKERLSGTNEKGEKKVFRQSAISHINDFLTFFESKNVTDDTGLDRIVADIKKIMAPVEVDALREDDKFRATIAKQFEQVTAQLETLVTAQPTRAVRLPTREA